MIRVFLLFLRKVCDVKEEKLRVYLYCFSDQSTSELISFWSEVTGIPVSQFTKPYVKPCGSGKKKMAHGVVHIRYGSKTLLMQIRTWICAYAVQAKYWAGTEVVNRV